MWSIYRKEFISYFSSLIGYVVIGFFLLVLGLMLWVFPDYSILEFPYASLEPLFNLAPTILMILIPAITMRSIAEEKSSGTIEFLFTKPISLWQLVWGKYLANFSLVLLTLIPTLLYFISILALAASSDTIDKGTILSSYLGLILLAGVFTAIGLFTSSITNNQIIAFILGIFMCFTIHWAFQFISGLPVFVGSLDYIIQQMGIESHYQSIKRGVLDSRDLIYFLSIIGLFVYLSKLILEKRKT